MKKKKDNKIMWILPIKLFNVDLAVRIGMSAEEANKLTFDKFKVEPDEKFGKFNDDGSTKGQFTKCKTGGYAIWIKDKKDVGTIVHEATHFVHSLFRDRRIPLIEETEEIYAYTMDYVLTTILKMKAIE